ncbi:ABC transporter ATP-binding protein [Candidatus Symbiothrix dinenymphae]|uniref:ABC transporter ATP-binding protein n=1 Tax=Candidatus Symbiothrix dinenymphae TaxID=467085 RepID=UPI0006BF1F5D|nr:ABC transporter ATP-binding protein [Candidatus Symbiothrix dinenymphae]GAP71251.1 ABC transporter, ATP-binding protein [Candidatus Symbiothrix dinenymphae]
MRDFFQILRRFVLPYKRYLALNIVMTVLSGLLTLVSFGALIPILNILFKIETPDVGGYMPVDWAHFSIDSFKEVFQNNLNMFITDSMQTHSGTYILIILGLFLIITTFFRTAAMYYASFFLIPLRTGVVRDIRNQINDKIISLPLSFFSEERKGDILARISGDVNEVENSVMSSLDMLFKNPIYIILYLLGMFLISWQLTLFVIVMLPIAGYIMGQVGKNLKRSSADGQRQWGNLMSQIEETLSGLRIIKAFIAEKKIEERFHKTNEQFRNTTMRIFRRQQLAHPMSELLGIITVAIVLWYGGSLILSDNSSIEASSFMYYLTIFYMIINPAKELSRSVYSIQKGLASMERVDKILKAETNITDPQSPKPIPFNVQINYKDIWFRYKDNWVLKGVNLTIPKGKTVALVGQSGSGKSTMVDLLPRFYDIEKGTILIDGVDIRDAKVHDVRHLMGIVNQEAILFNDTFFNNIAFGVANATLADVEAAAKIANAYEFIVATDDGFETNIGDRGGKLSGGQRQRISIARAVLKNPPILILDEATSALDTESERLVQDALEKLMQNRTTIIIAHRLSTIRNADLICVMHEGEIVERGTHTGLMSLNGYYSRLCAMQAM